ncbi:MAG: hypothetical protein HYV60_08110 [Planctomycetia bacterium]|nr:hypothetical protein [Planctomycetia bacterium]
MWGAGTGGRNGDTACLRGEGVSRKAEATYHAIDACADTPGLVKVLAGNYDGRLGKSFIYLHRKDQVNSPA